MQAIKFRMTQQGLAPKEPKPPKGRSHRVVEVLIRRRCLTLAMIQRQVAGPGVLAEGLLGAAQAGQARAAGGAARGHETPVGPRRAVG